MRQKSESFISLFSGDEDLREKNLAYNQYCSTFGPSPKTSIIPYFCKKELRNHLCELSPKIHAAINKSVDNFFTNPMDYPDLKIPDHLKTIVRKNKLFKDDNPVIRVDCFVGDNQDSIQILEFNCAEPSAYSWNDWMIRGLLANERIRKYFEKENMITDLILPKYIQMLLGYATAKKNKKINLYMPKDSTVYFDFSCLEFLLKENGFSVKLQDPSSFKGEADCIHIRDSFEDLIGSNGEILAPAILSAIQKQDLFIMNPSASTVADQKSLLPYLKHDLPIIDCDAITTIGIERLRSHKDQYVIKPSQGYGGFGIHIGKNTEQAAWNKTVEDIFNHKLSYIIQKYIKPDTFYDPITKENLHSNFSFWILGGQYAGAFARICKSELINFHQGGSLLPVVYY